MISNRWRGEWTELAVISVVSFFLYQMNMLILFCVPLQVLYYRRGERTLLYAAAAVLAAIGIAGLIRTAPVEDAVFRRGLLFIEIILPAFFLAGLIAADYRWKIPIRTLNKVFLVTAGAGLASVPLILALGRSENFNGLLRAQIENILRVFETGQAEGAGMIPDAERLTELIVGLLLRNYVFAYFLTVAGGIWVGRSIARRMAGQRTGTFRGFYVPERMIWPLLAPWALVLLDLRVDIGALRYVAWNAALIMTFTYGMQGVGILQTILDRRNVSRGFRIILGVALVLLALWPGVNLLVLIGLPGLGVSELWIHYRRDQKEKDEDENSESYP